ncbi:hypothetical protein M422DRAFT_245951 [Sphaerobolus stellatus SS14]|nr:hypothetical protein M422DRAFT_245951 [Sphaerobolus stellatus SS14]
MTSDTVNEILLELRLRRLIPQFYIRLEPILYYDNFQRTPIKNEARLSDLNIGNLAVLSLRYRVLGGMRTSINSQSANHPERWIVSSTQAGEWHCLVCNNGKGYQSKYLRRHEEEYAEHKRKLKRWLKNQTKRHSSHPSPSQPDSSVPRELVNTTLHSLLWTMGNGVLNEPLTPPPAEATDMSMDWDGAGIEFAGELGETQDQGIEKLGRDLFNFMLSEGAIDADSDDEPVERDEEDYDAARIPPPISPFDKVPDPEFQMGEKRRRSVTKVGQSEPWYPWPDKEACCIIIFQYVQTVLICV